MTIWQAIIRLDARVMPEKSRKDLIWQCLLLVVGAFAVLVVAIFSWVSINLPLNVRFPVPSPDGRYFAYFDRVRSEDLGGQSPYDLVVATEDGQLAGEFRESPGPILWSSANNVTVVNTQHSLATVIPGANGQFLPLVTLPLETGIPPVWSRDGTNLAYIRPGARGAELAIYNLQQPQSATVPLPAGFPLDRAWPLFWSPISDELYFLNKESDGMTLERVQIQTGDTQAMARGGDAWGAPDLRAPQMSPDGSRIYLPAPIEAVIQAQTGETVWKLPDFSTAQWSPWSGDGLFIYRRRDVSDQVFAHDFGTQTNLAILSGFPTDGIFSADGRNYFFRNRDGSASGDFLPAVRAWLKRDWGWRQVDVRTSKSEPLGRLTLWPSADAQVALIEAREDDYTHARVGFYNPDDRRFSPFVFPTARDDLVRQLKSQGALVLTTGLYGLLGFLVLLRRRKGSSARALAALSFLLMVTFSTFGATVLGTAPGNSWPGTFEYVQTLSSRRWLTDFDLSWLPLAGITIRLSELSVSLLPLALLHFAVVFPEGNPLLAARTRLRAAAYVVALIPFAATVATLFQVQVLGLNRTSVYLGSMLATALAIYGAFVVMFYNYRHPHDRRAKNQIGWVALAFAVPPVGVGLLMALVFVTEWVETRLGNSAYPIIDTNYVTSFMAFLCLFTPAAVGYALLARRPYDVPLLIRRALRYLTMAGLVAIVFLLLLGGVTWLTGSSFRDPSNLVIIASTLLTAGILAPVRERVEAVVDRLIARSSVEIRGALENLAEELPRILSRETLATRLEDTVRRTFRSRGVYLFALERESHRLRPLAGHQELSDKIRSLEFDPTEPVCRYLVEGKRPLEVEVSPYDPELIPIVRGAADRLERLGAALVFGLERRGELLGLMVIGAKESEDFFNAEEIGWLSAVARQATVAIENTGLFEEIARDREVRKELEVASEVQHLLFPANLPRSKTCQIAGRCVPARSVRGDFYDFLALPGNQLGLSMGDVSGEGVSASLLMASLQGLLRDQAPTAESPADLARRINRQLFSSSRGAKYCTFFYGVFDETTKQLTFVNAGHNPPLLFNSGTRKFLESTGVPLGLFPEVTHEVKTEALAPETLLVLYSDGITEARDEGGGFYGVDRLLSLVSRERHRSPEELVDRILEDVHAFSGAAVADDDQTLVVLRVHPA